MARECYICGKKPVSGGTVARRGMAKSKGGVGVRITGRSLRRFLPNIQEVRAVIGGKTKKIKICTKCLKAGKIVKAV
ncbi:MAG: 50S ribosomal protein L28 [Candidatus Omnitrophica bacterium]|nr:50S ribosomal protein L28 [Candidatus Omnitrophota bacterium]